MDLRLIPKPQIITSTAKNFSFTSNFKIYTNVKNNRFNTALEYLQKSLFDARDIWPEITEQESEASLKIKISTEADSRIPSDKIDEAYALVISNRDIELTAKTEKGLFYAVMSLLQIIENEKTIKCLSIVDWPDLSVRGISDDISRGQVSTLDNFKKIIRNIARYKMNTYMPYIEDMLELKCYPTIGVGRGALTHSEVKKLVDYAYKHYIEVIPIFQTLGHYENILLQDEFLQYADFPGSASLDVTNKDTYVFLENMLKEVFELFPSEYFNMGADESFDVGKGNSRELVKKTSLAKVHANHYKKVYDICKKYNKKVMMYGDVILRHPEILDDLPKDIIIVDWHYGGSRNYKSTVTFSEAGHEYYVSPSVWNFLTTFPTNVNALPNIKYITEEGLQHGSTGMINSNWGDYGAETLKELIYYGYAWSAQCSWSYSKSNLNSFTKNYLYDLFGTDDQSAFRIYQNLSNPLNQMMWHDIWRHPVLPLRKSVWWEPQNGNEAVKASWMELTLPQLEEDILALEKSAVKNRDHVEILKFMIDLYKWYQLKLEVNFILQDKIENVKIDNAHCLVMMDKCLNELNRLEGNYNSIWKTYYKEDNLNMITDKFNRLRGYLNETSDQIKNDTLESPKIESEWIYYPARRNKYAKEVTFKKTFDVKGKIESAQLQLIADTYAELSINGEKVDTIFAKRSLSLLVDYGRILFIDISKYLKKGKNIIEIKAENFERKGSAGINLIAEIKTGKETKKIISNKTWSVKKTKGNWKKAKAKEFKYIIIAPNFETKRPGWIERY
ncbi:MAG: family 20 glycosylhydrolase [Melioribacteraceae bacterium]|nr:family 20 glycosylhydrolase [Melioribacteraceae bacterium]